MGVVTPPLELPASDPPPFPPIRWEMMSTGTGKTMVLFFSADMLFNVCK